MLSATFCTPVPSALIFLSWPADMYSMVCESDCHEIMSATSLEICRAGPDGEPSGLVGITLSTESLTNATFVPSGEYTAAPSVRSEIDAGMSPTAYHVAVLLAMSITRSLL